MNVRFERWGLTNPRCREATDANLDPAPNSNTTQEGLPDYNAALVEFKHRQTYEALVEFQDRERSRFFDANDPQHMLHEAASRHIDFQAPALFDESPAALMQEPAAIESVSSSFHCGRSKEKSNRSQHKTVVLGEPAQQDEFGAHTGDAIYYTVIDGLVIAARASGIPKQHNRCEQCFNDEVRELTAHLDEKLFRYMTSSSTKQLHFALRLRHVGRTLDDLSPAIIISTDSDTSQQIIAGELKDRALHSKILWCNVQVYVVRGSSGGRNSTDKVLALVLRPAGWRLRWMRPHIGFSTRMVLVQDSAFYRLGSSLPADVHEFSERPLEEEGGRDVFVGAKDPLCRRPKRTRSEISSIISSQLSAGLRDFVRLAKRLNVTPQRVQTHEHLGTRSHGMCLDEDVLFSPGTVVYEAVLDLRMDASGKMLRTWDGVDLYP
ncbi:hypothetical protein LTR70_002605 [Exophiala xenobiotica]|uniref:Uncharacterized protein n=1 Tax=Lithohypha guttulata TaxID=1690604 RepID=A0ABR0KIC8_9EURO|nr:hypothetical protein LTR24_002218 [Lithohypha guttulata]KAK5325225.1 hypothetical protein LTR70_002605 [Exophiala xenobiotica]